MLFHNKFSIMNLLPFVLQGRYFVKENFLSCLKLGLVRLRNQLLLLGEFGDSSGFGDS